MTPPFLSRGEHAHQYTNHHLSRIGSLVGTDPGVFALACDSFLEGLAVHTGCPSGHDVTFQEKLEHIEEAFGLTDADRRTYRRLSRAFRDFRYLTNRVRHRFDAIDLDEVTAVQARFHAVLALLGCRHEVLERLVQSVEAAWSDRRSKAEYRERLKELQLAANRVRRDNEQLQERLEAYEALKAEHEAVTLEVSHLRAHLASLKKQKSSTKERVDELRRELFDATERARRAAAELAGQDDVAAYVEYLTRATTLTRTRLDYERSVMALSPEQAQAVDAVGDRGDYLVKGPAGTGKTLVLMHAVQQERDRIQAELGFDDHSQLGIFTFNKSLARFNRYLAGILGADTSGLTITNVDAFYHRELSAMGYGIVFRSSDLKAIIAEIECDVLPPAQLVVEVEEFILANDLSREQYVDQMVPRRGLKVPLRKAQRIKVWEAAERFRHALSARHTVSKQLGVQMLLRRVEEDEAYRRKTAFRRVFADEAQDLTALEIKLLASLSERGTIIVGDEQQRLYRFGGSFRRSGVDITNRSRTLETNYRNTVEICRLSERYRDTVGQVDKSELGAGSAFRHGPEPEVFVLSDADALWDEVVRRIHFFLDRLGYAGENIALLVPFHRMMQKAKRLLGDGGLETCNVTDREFSFETSPGVRLSTMHSAKGLEFPVVFLLLPTVTGDSAIGDDEAATRMRNLIYVSLTRAMDNLQVFTTERAVGHVGHVGRKSGEGAPAGAARRGAGAVESGASAADSGDGSVASGAARANDKVAGAKGTDADDQDSLIGEVVGCFSTT